MTKLRLPIARELSDAPSELELRRVWAGVGRRRARRQAFGEVWRVARVAAPVLALVVLSLLWLRGSFNTPRPEGALLADNRAPRVLDGAAQRRVLLSDGSQLELSQAAHLEVVDNSGSSFVTVLHAGRVLFDVQPGGPRRWTIEAGLASIEVVGTRFSVERVPDSVQVAVEHGVVLVRGESVPDHIQRLTAGGRLRIGARAVPAAAASNRPPPAPLPAASSSEAARPAPSAEPGPSFDALLRRADAERRAGHLADAERSLGAAIASAPDGARASLAAFTLGKLLLDGSHRPADAAKAFARAVALGPPAAIAEDALARLVEAEGRAGNSERARAAAKQYALRYPHGPKLYAVTPWLEQH